MFKLKKILLFILIFIVFLLLGNSKVFATLDVTYDGVNYTIPNIPELPTGLNYTICFFYMFGKQYNVVFYQSDKPFDYYSNLYEADYYGLSWSLNSHPNNPISYRTGRISSNNASTLSSQTWSIDSVSSTSNFLVRNKTWNPSSIVYANYNVILEDYNTHVTSSAYTMPVSYENFPYFLNSEEDIAIGEQDLIIMPGDFPNDKTISFAVQVVEEQDDGQGGVLETITNIFNTIPLNSDSQYYCPIDDSGVGFYYKIPWSFLRNYLQVGKQYNYVLAYDINDEHIVNDLYVTYGGLTPEDALKNSIANQSNLIREQTIIQNQTLQEQQHTNEKLDNLSEEQQQTNNKLDNLNNNINNSNIESSASDLPSTDVTDITANGIDNIFQSIYNAFCVGQAQDIIFPIPFTNKNITLSPYYIRDMLQNNGAGWIYTFIQAFWAYLIGRFIVKDISKKISKIKSGNIESIQDSNIKEDML